MIKTRLILIFSLALFLALPLSAQAFSVKADDSVYIAEDETVIGNLYAAGANITVDGTVVGDVICGAQSVNINGKVEGDVICGAQSVNINGEVGGSVRAAGNTVNINGKVARGVQAFGASIVLGKDAQVGWDMFIAGANGEIRGKVGGDLHGGAANVVIAGEVGRNVRLKLDERVESEAKGIKFKKISSPLTITKEAKIGGEVVYTAGREGDIEEGAMIIGEVTYNPVKFEKSKRQILYGWAWSRLYSIFTALVIGLVLISIWRKQIIRLTDRMLDKVGVSIGWGAVVMFLTPIIAILLLITVIGIPLAFLLAGAWLIAIFLSKILVGIMIGRSLMDKLWHKKKDSLIWAMIIGVVVCWIIFSIPVVGWILCLVALWWGLGGIWLQFRET